MSVNSELTARVTAVSQPDIMDQNLKPPELVIAMSRNTVQPTNEEIKQMDARRLHCKSGHCNGLRRDGPPQGVCKRATELTCDACEYRNRPQPRNREKFEHDTKTVQLSEEQVMSRVTSMHNELDRIKGDSSFQWTFAHSRPVWNTEATDSTDPITVEQNLRIRTDAANVYLQTRAHRRILELDRSRNRNPRRL